MTNKHLKLEFLKQRLQEFNERVKDEKIKWRVNY